MNDESLATAISQQIPPGLAGANARVAQLERHALASDSDRLGTYQDVVALRREVADLHRLVADARADNWRASRRWWITVASIIGLYLGGIALVVIR